MIDYGSSQSKKQYTRRIGDSGFLGADFSTAPIFASPRRFRDLKNVWKDYKSGSGVAIETVPGYRAIENYVSETVGVTSEIHGIFRFDTTKSSADTTPLNRLNKDSSGVWYIVHYGNTLACFSEMSFFASLDMRVVMGFVTLPDKDSIAIQNGNNLVIICDGKIFSVFPCEIEFDFHAYPSTWFAFEVVQLNQYEAFDVNHFHAQYSPTTYLNGVPYEQKNMLTARSKEIYHATTIQGTRYDPITSDPSYYYYLSCVLHEKVKATTSSPYTGNIVSFKIDGTSQTPYAIVSNGYITELRFDYTGSSHQNEDHTVEVEYASDPALFTSYRDFEDYKDRTTFNEGNPDYSGTAYDAIAGCTICASFDERIFLAGNPKLPNTIFYSQRDLTGYNNPTYFGVLNYNNLGTSNAPITALVPSANALYVLKDDSATDPTMYVLTGKTTEIDLLPRIYTVESGLPGIGCKGAACNFLDDIVFMSKNGVIGIDKQAVNLERTLGDRSVLINGRLTREDPTKAIFAEWEGYLAVLFTNNGHLYLADHRAYTQGAGYEWYFIDSVGSWYGDEHLYEYNDEYVRNYGANGQATVTAWNGTEYAVVERGTDGDTYTGNVQTVYLDTLANSSPAAADTDGRRVILVETESGSNRYYQVKTTGERVGGTFHPATCMVASNDRIFFGTDNGDLLTFNTDKRGVPSASEECADLENNPGSKNRYPNLIRPKWYSFCGHRIESYVETEDDDAGVANATKDTVKRSVVVDLKALLGSRYKVTTYTDRDGWNNDNVATGAINDLSSIGFGSINFKGDDHVYAQIRERARKWIHKRYKVESNGFNAPFGIYRITYSFEIAGRVK